MSEIRKEVQELVDEHLANASEAGLDAIRWTLHTGAKWSEIPAQYGASTTCWRWYERWCSDGTWQQIAATLELSDTEVGRKPERRPTRAKSRRGDDRPIDVTAVETSAPL